MTRKWRCLKTAQAFLLAALPAILPQLRASERFRHAGLSELLGRYQPFTAWRRERLAGFTIERWFRLVFCAFWPR